MKKPEKGTANSYQQSFFSEDSATSSNNQFSRLYLHLTDAKTNTILLSVIALSFLKGVGFHSVCELYDSGIIDKIWDMPQDEIIELVSELPVSKRLNITQMMETKGQVLSTAEKVVADLHSQNIVFLPIGSKNYPKSLQRLQDPPRWIFVKGNIDCLQASAIIAVVGTRKATATGLKLASQCAGELAKRNAVVLSGLAKGIDENAHQGAVDYYGQSIAVLGYGLISKDAPHNPNLAEQIIECDGAIVSEYLPFDIPSRNGFLRRNELQVALSNVVIPIECPSLESGTGATIRRAMKIETPVVGITPPENEINESLKATKTNLENLNKPVFKVRSENSKDFWNFLQEIVPDHDWSINPKPGQDRLFREISKRINMLRKPLSIDESAIDRLARELKAVIKKE